MDISINYYLQPYQSKARLVDALVEAGVEQIGFDAVDTLGGQTVNFVIPDVEEEHRAKMMFSMGHLIGTALNVEEYSIKNPHKVKEIINS